MPDELGRKDLVKPMYEILDELEIDREQGLYGLLKEPLPKRSQLLRERADDLDILRP